MIHSAVIQSIIHLQVKQYKNQEYVRWKAIEIWKTARCDTEKGEEYSFVF